MRSDTAVLPAEPLICDSPRREPMTGAMLFWIFLAGSVAGFFLEGLWCVLRKGVWESHPATVWGPFCVIYGAGALALTLAAPWLQSRSLSGQFVLCAGVGTLVELAGSLAQEKVFGSASWDYSRHLLNLGGRVSLGMTLLWGSLGLCFVHLVLPAVLRLLEGPESGLWRGIRLGLTVFLALDLLVSAAAMIRWRERTTGCEGTDSALERYLDRVWDNGRMERRYPSIWFEESRVSVDGESDGLPGTA